MNNWLIKYRISHEYLYDNVHSGYSDNYELKMMLGQSDCAEFNKMFKLF